MLGAPIAPVNDLEDFLADAQVRDSGIVIELDHPGAGPVPVLRSAPRFSETPSNVRRKPPRLGEHSREVLTEAGLSDEQITSLLGGGR